jgi:hypothetical protein
MRAMRSIWPGPLMACDERSYFDIQSTPSWVFTMTPRS